MIKQKWLLLLALSLGIITSAYCANKVSGAPQSTVQVVSSEKMTPITGKSIQGEPSYEGITLVVCFQTWCGPCKDLIPDLNKVDKDPNISVVGVSDESTYKLKRFLRNYDVDYAVYQYDNEFRTNYLRNRWRGSVPFILVLDEQRLALYTSSWKDVRTYLEKLEK